MEHATLPKEEHKTRDIWTAVKCSRRLWKPVTMIFFVWLLTLPSHSLRMGELGLTRDCIDISPPVLNLVRQASSLRKGVAEEVNREAMAKIWTVRTSCSSSTDLRQYAYRIGSQKLLRPKQVSAGVLTENRSGNVNYSERADIEELKDLFGDEFMNFNLIFCSSMASRLRGGRINRAFNKLIEEKGLPK